MGWHRKDIELGLGPIAFLYSWSLIPIAISILMLVFDKYTEYLFYACLSALALQSASLYLIISKRKISLHYDSIKKRLIITSLILFIFMFSQFTNTEYSSSIQVIVAIIFSYYIINTHQIITDNIG